MPLFLNRVRGAVRIWVSLSWPLVVSGFSESEGSSSPSFCLTEELILDDVDCFSRSAVILASFWFGTVARWVPGPVLDRGHSLEAGFSVWERFTHGVGLVIDNVLAVGLGGWCGGGVVAFRSFFSRKSCWSQSDTLNPSAESESPSSDSDVIGKSTVALAGHISS